MAGAAIPGLQSHPKIGRLALPGSLRIGVVCRQPVSERGGRRRLEGREHEERGVVVRAASRNGAQGPKTAESRHALKDPAHVWGRTSSDVRVQDLGGDVSLDHYMRLPVEQYAVLDPRLITSLGGNRFQLQVPKVDLLSVWIEPVATIVVEQGSDPPSVNLRTESCEIRGSDALHALGLDNRFSLQFDAKLTWRNDRHAAPNRDNGATRQDHSLTRGRPTGAWIYGDARCDVWCEVVPPFMFMPREVMEGSCNVALQALMQALLPLFLSNLRNDYRKWGTDAAYRRRRAEAPEVKVSRR